MISLYHGINPGNKRTLSTDYANKQQNFPYFSVTCKEFWLVSLISFEVSALKLWAKDHERFLLYKKYISLLAMNLSYEGFHMT